MGYDDVKNLIKNFWAINKGKKRFRREKMIIND